MAQQSEGEPRRWFQSALPVILGGCIAAISGLLTAYISNWQQTSFQREQTARQEEFQRQQTSRQENFQERIVREQQDFQKEESERQFRLQREQALKAAESERRRLLFERRLSALKAYGSAYREGSSKFLRLANLKNRLSDLVRSGEQRASEVGEILDEYRQVVAELVQWMARTEDEATVVDILFDNKTPRIEMTLPLFSISPGDLADVGKRRKFVNDLDEEVAKLFSKLLDMNNKQLAYVNEASKTVR